MGAAAHDGGARRTADGRGGRDEVRGLEAGVGEGAERVYTVRRVRRMWRVPRERRGSMGQREWRAKGWKV